MLVYNKKSPPNTKGNAQQWWVFESPVQTKSKLTLPILATLARWHDRSCSAVLA